MKTSTVKKMLSALSLLFLPCTGAFAQKDLSSMLSTTTSTLKAIIPSVVNIFSIIMGLIGVVMLAPDLAKFMKGEGASADSMLKHGGGLLIAVILLQIIRSTLLS